MSAISTTQLRRTESITPSKQGKRDLLFEQIGKTAASSKRTDFRIELVDEGTEGAITPLADYDDL